MQDYRNIIESLPEDDKPDFFGLPANIARSSQRIISSQVKLAFFVDLWILYAAILSWRTQPPVHKCINFNKKVRVNECIFLYVEFYLENIWI